MLLTADLADAVSAAPMTVQRVEDYPATTNIYEQARRPAGEPDVTIQRRERYVHPEDVASLQSRLDVLGQSVGTLIPMLQEGKLDISGVDVGDFAVDGGQLELHGLLFDSTSPFRARDEVMTPGATSYRMHGSLITPDAGIFRHSATRYYGPNKALKWNEDKLQAVTPCGRIGLVGLTTFRYIDGVVERGEHAVLDLGNRHGIVTPLHRELDLTGDYAVHQ